MRRCSFRTALVADPLDDLGSYAAAEAVKAEAHRLSLELLESWLSPEQLSQFKASLTFTVKGEHSGTVYQIRLERIYNILVLDEDGKPGMPALCVMPSMGTTAFSTDQVPLGDQLLAQKIWLETDEVATVEKANKRWYLYA
jgi:hypothetical protein